MFTVTSTCTCFLCTCYYILRYFPSYFSNMRFWPQRAMLSNCGPHMAVFTCLHVYLSAWSNYSSEQVTKSLAWQERDAFHNSCRSGMSQATTAWNNTPPKNINRNHKITINIDNMLNIWTPSNLKWTNYNLNIFKKKTLWCKE